MCAEILHFSTKSKVHRKFKQVLPISVAQSRDCLTPDSETGFASFRTSRFSSDCAVLRLVAVAVLMVR